MTENIYFDGTYKNILEEHLYVKINKTFMILILKTEHLFYILIKIIFESQRVSPT